MFKTLFLAALAALPAFGQEPVATLCEQYGYHSAEGYELLNNLWGQDSATSGSQCTYYYGPAGSGISWGSDWTWEGGENDVKSYVYVGPWSYDTSDIRANVAYDIFTHTDPEHTNSNGDYELMIWLHRFGGVWPITVTEDPIEKVTIAGRDWDLYFGYNGEMKVYSFLPPNENPISDFSGDVKEFFDHLTSSQSFPESTQYMLIYQFGTEAFTGGPAKFTVSEFSAEVN